MGHWNIISILDEKNQDTNWVAVRAPIKSQQEEDNLALLVREMGKKIILLSSYQEFPGKISNPHEYIPHRENVLTEEFGEDIVLWCHCFRPEKMSTLGIPPAFEKIPRILLSESDFYASQNTLMEKASIANHPTEKKYDFFVSLPGGDWNTWIRGVQYGVRWINYMFHRLGMTFLVVGENRQSHFLKGITVIGNQTWDDFTSHMNSCRYLFCPSHYDASPRILVEALCLNLPILLNNEILGGWKYIQEKTGMLYNPKDNIRDTLQKFLKKALQFEPQKSSRIMLDRERSAKVLASALLSSTLWVEDENETISRILDGVVLINLDKRTDRLEEMNQEFLKMQIPDSLITRISATYIPMNGHLGCACSHIEALEMIWEKGWTSAIILEDDFEFSCTREFFIENISVFMKTFQEEWDVLMLTASYLESSPTTFTEIHRVHQGLTTAGYIVHSRFIPILLENFKESRDLMKKEMEESNPEEKIFITDHAIDQRWLSLQKKYKFYIFQPFMGKQSGKTLSEIMS